MSKRYLVNEKKGLHLLENVGAGNLALSGHRLYVRKVTADVTLAAADSGSVILVNPTATTEITLPTVGVDIAGWNCAIVVTEDAAQTDGGMGQIVNVYLAGSNHIGQVQDATGTGSDFADTADDYFVFTAAATPGDRLELWTDGSRWYAQAYVRALADSSFSANTDTIA